MAHLSESRERYVEWGRLSCWLSRGKVQGQLMVNGEWLMVNGEGLRDER